MHTVVRVRILHADVASDASYAERVQREAEAASGIHHPNIVEIVDVGVASGRSFVVRELVEGATLADLLAGGGNIREEEARRIGEPPAPTTLAPTLPAATPRRRASALPALLVAVPLLLALLFAALTFRPPAPRDTAVLSATTTPATTASPAPTSLPPVEATPEPTSLPTPEAIAEATAAPPVAVPTAAPPAAAEPAQTSSTATVSSFYALINQEQYDQAAALWSPRMQASYPPSTNIYGRSTARARSSFAASLRSRRDSTPPRSRSIFLRYSTAASRATGSDSGSWCGTARAG